MSILHRSFYFLLAAALFLVSAQRLPAPIQEVPESPTPAAKDSLKQKPKTSVKSKPKSQTTSSPAPQKQQPAAKRTRFAGSWVGIMPTFPWGKIPQTITVDPAETTMTRLRDWSSEDPGGTVKAEVKGDTLVANFGSGGTLSLTPSGDGLTALVRLQAPFNNQTATFRKTSP